MARDDAGLHLTSEWRVDVTDQDIRAARDAWMAAREGDAEPARVDALHRGYERLVRTQGRQLIEAVQQHRSR